MVTQVAARQRKVRVKRIPDPQKDKRVQHTIGELTDAAHDAIQEVLAFYLASPDTLRSLVKEELGRRIRYNTHDTYCESETFIEQVSSRARDMAIQEFNKPENFDLLVEQLKTRYLEEFRKALEDRVKSRASMDAYDAYQRAWRRHE